MSKKFNFLWILFLFLSCSAKETAANSYEKFKPVLNKAMLQCPTSHFNKNCSRHYGDFEGFSNKYFYYKNDDLMFYMCGNHHRSELRFRDEFYFNDKKEKILEAEVKLDSNTDEFTFLQIHGLYTGLDKPVLRVALYKGKIKLFVFNGKKYIKKDLGKYEGGFLKFKIIAGKGYLIIYENNELVFKTPINYPDKCYYKLGVYLQRDGCAKSEFKDIKVY